MERKKQTRYAETKNPRPFQEETLVGVSEMSFAHDHCNEIEREGEDEPRRKEKNAEIKEKKWRNKRKKKVLA